MGWLTAKGSIKLLEKNSQPWSDATDSGDRWDSHARAHSSVDTVWAQAKSKHMKDAAFNSDAVLVAPAFVQWGVIELALGKILWTHRHEIAKCAARIVHFSSQAELVAVFNKENCLMQVRRFNDEWCAKDLWIKAMPSSATGIEGMSRAKFSECNIYELLWFYGQRGAEAVQALPELRHQRLSIRRFPRVSPSTLLMRQLALIHILSQSPMCFEQLLQETDDDDRDSLCADLSSLYLTRSLSIT